MKNWMKRNGLPMILLIALIGSFALPAIGEDYARPWVNTQKLYLDGTEVTSTADELNYLDVTAGTAAASKALVLGTSKEIATITSLTATNIDAGASGSAGSVDVFPTSATSGKISIAAADSGGDYTTTITNASQAANRTYTIPDAGAAAYFVMSTVAQSAAGAISRADLVENSLQAYGIPINQIMADDGLPLTVSEEADTFFLALGTNTVELQGEEAISETEASVSYIQFVLPPEYVAAGDVKIRIRCKIDGAGTNDGSTVDIEVYEQADGAVGSDLCETAAATFAVKSTWYSKDFVVTATDLVAGDILMIKLTSSVIEDAGSALAFYADPPKVLLDIKG
jgi:hypothetical protein